MIFYIAPDVEFDCLVLELLLLSLSHIFQSFIQIYTVNVQRLSAAVLFTDR
jgi:hypothetical protein